MKRLFLSLIIFFSHFIGIKAQDTVFVTKHNFSSPVRNVFNVGREVYAKIGEYLYKMEEDNWIQQKSQFEKTYVFFKEGFYESDYIPNSELFDASGMKDLIPQRGLFITTSAVKDSRLFIASGSSLFEYYIFDHYSKSYYNASIRDIFINDSLKVISTYSGIFVNGALRSGLPPYSNGPLVYLDSTFYFCIDELLKFYPPDSTSIIKSATNVFAGNIRNMVEWKGKLYTQNTQSINLLSDDYELTPIHREQEYMDLVEVNEGLIFSSAEGNCFFWNGENTIKLASLDSKIRDIYPFENILYLASDDGVYTIENLDPATLEKVFDTKFNIHIEKDNLGNTWISTENGLFVYTKEYPQLLPVIGGVEFNREAFIIHGDSIFVGAIDGLYSLNTIEISKSFIPAAINRLEIQSPDRRIIAYLSILLLVSIVGGLFWFVRWRKKTKLSEGSEETRKSKIDLEELRNLIVLNRINSVEALATYLNTNTVQLNRNFREEDITPGKFLKSVKLEYAKELLANGSSIEDVANLIGYSTRFLKKELEEE